LLWYEVIKKNNIKINEQEKVELIEKVEDHFVVKTSKQVYKSNTVLLAIGRRGTPRKLGIPGETREKVYYRLLDPEIIKEQKILVIGGGDSAIESAMLLSGEGNEVTISYRGNNFSRLKQKNHQKINEAIQSGVIKVFFNSNIKEILEDKVIVEIADSESVELKNNLVYIFAGGELPAAFLERTGIRVTKKFGDAILTHKKK
jgi:thioredoxin reductase (NADPH)